MPDYLPIHKRHVVPSTDPQDTCQYLHFFRKNSSTKVYVENLNMYIDTTHGDEPTPEGETYASIIEGLTRMPFHYWISQNIHTLDQRKEIGGELLERKRRIAKSMASGNNNVSDIEERVEAFEIRNSPRNHVRVRATDQLRYQRHYLGRFKRKLEEGKSEEVLRAFRSMNQAEGLVGRHLHLKTLSLTQLPAFARDSGSEDQIVGKLRPTYAGVCGWMGNNRPVVLLTNREGGALLRSIPLPRSCPTGGTVAVSAEAEPARASADRTTDAPVLLSSAKAKNSSGSTTGIQQKANRGYG